MNKNVQNRMKKKIKYLIHCCSPEDNKRTTFKKPPQQLIRKKKPIKI